jgi:RNA polymerase sigma factor (sigma-70 family)
VFDVFDAATAELVRLAEQRDQLAWAELVRRFAALVWSVARENGLGAADAADVCQVTWLTLAQNLGRLREPDRLAAWLATTARRESVRVRTCRRREVPLSEPGFEPGAVCAGPEEAVLTAAAERELWQALAGMPDQCRQLLRLFAHAPELSYAQTARALGIGVGSVGKTRGRCLSALRRRLAVAR